MKEKILKNTFYSGISSAIIGLTGFFLLPFMIAKVGIVEYGLVGISSIFAMSGYVSLLELGFQKTIAKYTAEYHAQNNEIKICRLISTMFWVFMAIGILLMIVGLSVTGLILSFLKLPAGYRSSFQIALTIIFVSYVFQFPNLVFAGLFEGLQRFDILKGIQVIAAILSALSVIILLMSGYGYIAIVCSTIAALIIQCLLYFILSFKTLPYLSIRYKHFSIRYLAEIWQMAKYLFAGKISSLIYHQTPRVLISIFLGAAVMTSYEVVIRLPRFLKVMLGFVNAAVTPAASELNAGKKKAFLQQLFLRGLRYQIFFIYPIVIGAIFFAQPFLAVWVGDDFTDHFRLLQFMLLWNLITPIITYGGSLFVGMNFKLKQLTALHIILTLLSLAISILLLKTYGLAGIIIGFVGANLIVFPLYLNLYLNKFEVSGAPLIKDGTKILLSAMCPIGILYFIDYLVPAYNPVIFGLKFIIWCGFFWITLYRFVLTGPDRNEIAGILKIFFDIFNKPSKLEGTNLR